MAMDRKGDLPAAGGHSRSRGRTAPAEELRRQLASAPLPFLEGAMQNPELSHEEMAILLRNRNATGSLLGRIGRDRSWTRYYEVKKGLVLHPRTPFHVSRSLVGHLYWRDLAETAEQMVLNPALRRKAEEVLKVRVDEMSLGEQIALARRASRGLVASLKESAEDRVLRALLDNARLVERDAVEIASGEHSPPDTLERLAEHPTWGERYSVRLALIRNAATPVRVALRLAGKLPSQDLRRLSGDPEVPKIVRVGVERKLQSLEHETGDRTSRE
jgi:hypothetical protein